MLRDRGIDPKSRSALYMKSKGATAPSALDVNLNANVYAIALIHSQLIREKMPDQMGLTLVDSRPITVPAPRKNRVL